MLKSGATCCCINILEIVRTILHPLLSRMSNETGVGVKKTMKGIRLTKVAAGVIDSSCCCFSEPLPGNRG